MSLNLFDPRTVAAELHRARTDGRAIRPPDDLSTISLIEAYAIQDAVVACRERDGGVRSGWKLGLTSGVKQQLMGIDRPVFGRLFESGFVTSGKHVRFGSFIAPRVEPELAFGLAAPLDPDVDVRGLRNAVAWCAPALEITDSRYLPGRRSAIELVADNTSAAAYVIGPRLPLDAVDALLGSVDPASFRLDSTLPSIPARIVRNDTVLSAGTTTDVLGDPFVALTLLARHLFERGLRTAAGDVVLSGAITDAFPAARGDRFAARLDGLGIAEVTFV